MWLPKCGCRRGLLSFDLELGLILDDIIGLSKIFELCAFSFVCRKANKGANSIAHLQPYNLDSRVWLEDGAECNFDRALNDLCNHLNLDE